jgi:hypothetical protein
MVDSWAQTARGVQEHLDTADLLTRLARWAEAAAGRQVAQAARDAETTGGTGWTVVEEHALRTGQTSFDAKRLARTGRAGLDEPAIRRAQDEGGLSTVSCDAIMSTATRLDDPDHAAQVIETGLRLASHSPPGKVRRAVSLIAARLDPAAFTRNHARAVEDRHVRVTAKPDGMAELRAYGPAVDVQQMMAGVERAARKTAPYDREAGVRRTAAQRGFDCLVDVWKPGEDQTRPRSTREIAAQTHLLVKVDADVLAGLSDQPARLVGSGEPVPADVARQIAGDSTWQAIIEDAGRIVGLGDHVCPPGRIPDPAAWPAETLSCDSYQASPPLKLLLEIRDGGCVTPNVRREALGFRMEVRDLRLGPVVAGSCS